MFSLLLQVAELQRQRSRSRETSRQSRGRRSDSREGRGGRRSDSREGRGGRNDRSGSRGRAHSPWRPSAMAGAAISTSRGSDWRPGGRPMPSEAASSDWRPGGARIGGRVETIPPSQRRRHSKPPAGFFTGSVKGQVQESSTTGDPACPWVSDSEDDIPKLRALSPLEWDEDGRAVSEFREVSQLLMLSQWGDAARLLRDFPKLCSLRIPDDQGTGAGYGLLHTLLTKRAPDWLVDWVLHRTPMGVLGLDCNQKFQLTLF